MSNREMQTYRILVIEDNPDHTELIRTHLEPAKNFEVENAATAAEGLKKAKDGSFHVILLDFRLPDQDGLEVLQEMKKLDIKVPVIFITAYGDIKVAIEAMKRGACDYLSKPEIFSPMLPRVLQGVWEMFQIQRETENKILRAAEEWRRTFDSMMDMVAIIDNNYVILRANKAVAKATGLSIKEVVGKKCYKVFHGLNNVPKYCPLAKITKTSKSQVVEMEEPHLGKILLFSYSPLRDEKGVVTRTIHLIRDMTEQRRVEKAARDFEQMLNRAFFGMTEAMAAMVEAKDPYTAGHGEGVARIAVAIAKKMKLSDDDIEGIRIGALLHDIGKIAIPTEILTKPAALTNLDRAIVQQHPKYSFEILKKIDFPWPVAETALQHHERLDGSGYPRGLKGNQIILPARILAVADVADAMSSHRPYRAALGLQTAIATIKEGHGTLYDGAVVDAWLRSIPTSRGTKRRKKILTEPTTISLSESS